MMREYDRAREKIARQLFFVWIDVREDHEDDKWEDLPERHQEYYRRDADAILSLPEICVIDDALERVAKRLMELYSIIRWEDASQQMRDDYRLSAQAIIEAIKGGE